MLGPLSTARRPSRGLTLIELLVVVAVIALIGLSAAPSFTQVFARGSLRGNASEAYADLQFARAEAVQRNAEVTVTFNGGGYTITSGGTTLKAMALSGGTVVSSGSTMAVVFNPVRATATVTDGPAVFSHPALGGTVRVAVNLLGRVEICSPSAAVNGVAPC